MPRENPEFHCQVYAKTVKAFLEGKRPTIADVHRALSDDAVRRGYPFPQHQKKTSSALHYLVKDEFLRQENQTPAVKNRPTLVFIPIISRETISHFLNEVCQERSHAPGWQLILETSMWTLFSYRISETEDALAECTAEEQDAFQRYRDAHPVRQASGRPKPSEPRSPSFQRGYEAAKEQLRRGECISPYRPKKEER
jgi:hypothetical protein